MACLRNTCFKLHLPPILFLIMYCIVVHNGQKPGSVFADPLLVNSTGDHLTLLSIKSLLVDSTGALVSWDNKSLHYCQWRGVVCAGIHPARVRALNLDSLGLTGTISPQIGNMTFLHTINLANNQLHGFLPQELGNLSRLRHLNLGKNSFEGNIPSSLSLCSNLVFLNLEDNILQGSIPHGLGSCLKLRAVSLKNNILTGEIPGDFGLLPVLDSLNLSNNELNGNLFPLMGNNSLRYVNISDNNITGTIPPSLFNYSLQYLDLTNNIIGGAIPVSVGTTRFLEYLFLGKNNLVGSIPSSICTISSFKYLVLSENMISGNIPSSLGNCSTLKYLYLHKNRLTGVLPAFPCSNSFLHFLSLKENHLSGILPSSFGNCSFLVYLGLSENYFSGIVPESLGRLTHLSVLDLTNNSFSSIIPSSIYNLSSLNHLFVSVNNLVGTIPETIGYTLPEIKSLVMDSNRFNGYMPSSLYNASKLELLSVGDNSLQGIVPSKFGLLNYLQELDISSNKLQNDDWNFLSSLTNCSLLRYLSFEDNNMQGILPNFVGNLSTNLEYLLIGKNHLSGPIPSEIEKLVNLTLLSMDQCLLNGSIPASIGKVYKLSVLNLGRNELSGPIPFSIGNLTELVDVYMEENKLAGNIPSSFGRCKLNILNLSHNLLTENVPTEIMELSSLSELDLSYNYLCGSIPLEIGTLINLVRLDVSNNNFSDEIPRTISQCQVLEFLYMQENSFQGTIPQSFIKLRSLMELDLSRNQLAGQIPDFLPFLYTLEFLDLSFNNLQGEVLEVGIFLNSTKFSITGNKQLCGSMKMPKLPPCVEKKTLFHTHKLLVYFSLISLLACFGLVFFVVTIFKSKRKQLIICPVSSYDNKFKKVTYQDIAEATNWFSDENLLGSGRFGLVYKGKLGGEEDLVAIKVFRLEYSGALESFTAECAALRKLRHRNLIKVNTSCSSLNSEGNEFKALIFEYMKNGSLEEWLHPECIQQGTHKILNLGQRVSIAADIASALSYMHHDQCACPVIHCDLKPSNVLLDGDMIAHVSDFGLSKFLGDSTAKSQFGSMTGTIGYTPPEYGIGNPTSTTGDVYSYGVVLLEILTGKRPTDAIFDSGFNLREYVEMAFPDKLEEVLDPTLMQDGNECIRDRSEKATTANSIMEECIVPFAKLGLCCSKDSPRDRMEMRDVAKEINMIKETLYKLIWTSSSYQRSCSSSDVLNFYSALEVNC